MKFVITVLLIFVSSWAFGQNDSIPNNNDSEKQSSIFKFNTDIPVPKRAGFYSALVPGLGQVYNKQYWKLGIVAGGLAAAGYFIQTNGRKYKQYRNAYILRVDNNINTVDTDEETVNYSDADLNTLQNEYRQYLEYSVVFTTVGYALNVLDAYVAANLRTFDINDDISFHAKPTYENRQPGLALVFKLK